MELPSSHTLHEGPRVTVHGRLLIVDRVAQAARSLTSPRSWAFPVDSLPADQTLPGRGRNQSAGPLKQPGSSPARTNTEWQRPPRGSTVVAGYIDNILAELRAISPWHCQHPSTSRSPPVRGVNKTGAVPNQTQHPSVANLMAHYI